MTDWQFVGAWRGGTVSSVAVSADFESDGIALAATGAGIYRTMDHGKQWQRTITGFTDVSAVAITFAPDNRGAQPIAFASAETGRLYRSADGGMTWSEMITWAGLGLVTAIALSPDYANDKTIFVGTSNGVYRSFDDGVGWEEASFGLLDLEILCLTCAPDFAESGVLWVGTALGGFYRSRNRGLAWRESGVGLPDAAIQCMAVVPRAGNAPMLFVGTESDGVYRSDNQGALWERAGDALAGLSVNALALSQDEEGALLVAGTNEGIYYATVTQERGDETWHAAANGDLLAFAMAATQAGTMLAATFQESLAFSTDAGRSWQRTGAELAGHTPPLLFPTATGSIYALDTDGAVAVSQDDGATWSPLPVNDELSVSTTLAVSEDPAAPLLYAATEQALLRHVTTAVEWEPLPLPTTNVTHVVLSPGPATDQQLLLANLTGELYHSADGGTAWQPIAQPWQGEAVLVLRFSPNYLVDHLVRVVTARATATGHYKLTLWQSTVPAHSWTAVATLETEIPSVLIAQPAGEQTNRLFLATGHRLITFSTAADPNEWAVQQHFFADDLRVTALALSPTFAADQTLFAATTQGVFVSRDGGERWSQHAGNPRELPIVALLPARDSQLRAVTLGGEVWFQHTYAND